LSEARDELRQDAQYILQPFRDFCGDPSEVKKPHVRRREKWGSCRGNFLKSFKGFSTKAARQTDIRAPDNGHRVIAILQARRIADMAKEALAKGLVALRSYSGIAAGIGRN